MQHIMGPLGGGGGSGNLVHRTEGRVQNGSSQLSPACLLCRVDLYVQFTHIAEALTDQCTQRTRQ